MFFVYNHNNGFLSTTITMGFSLDHRLVWLGFTIGINSITGQSQKSFIMINYSIFILLDLPSDINLTVCPANPLAEYVLWRLPHHHHGLCPTHCSCRLGKHDWRVQWCKYVYPRLGPSTAVWPCLLRDTPQWFTLLQSSSKSHI